MVKVYVANIELLQEPKVFSEWFSCMHPMRQEKVLHCKMEFDKKRSLLAGILLKMALEEQGYDYGMLEFSVEPHGRPVMKGADDIYFSLSHAGDYALCCVSDQLVGADIEVMSKAIFQVEKTKKMQSMAEKILSRAEYDIFLKAEAGQRVLLFLKYWTRKESYSKALGEGLRMKFSDIDTECMEEFFWSNWGEDYCISIYTEKNNPINIDFQKISKLEK